MMFGCIFKKTEDRKDLDMGKVSYKVCDMGKTVTYHGNTTKPHSKKNAKQNNSVATEVNYLKERA